MVKHKYDGKISPVLNYQCTHGWVALKQEYEREQKVKKKAKQKSKGLKRKCVCCGTYFEIFNMNHRLCPKCNENRVTQTHSNHENIEKELFIMENNVDPEPATITMQ